MATSGSTDWSLTLADIVLEALDMCKVIQSASGDTPSANQNTMAYRALNKVFKRLQTQGVRLMSLEWVQKAFTASSEVTYDLVVYTCIKSHTSATATDRPGTGTNWTTNWKIGGTAGASAWADSTAYVAIGEFAVASDTIGIEQAFIRRVGGTDHPVELITSAEYADISNKHTPGITRSLWLERLLAPTAHLYPVPTLTTDVLHYQRVRVLEDFDNSSDDPDFLVRYTDLLTWQLADDLSTKFDLPLQERNWIRARASEKLEDIKDSDHENDSQNFMEPLYG